jgi:hypothetical protein
MYIDKDGAKLTPKEWYVLFVKKRGHGDLARDRVNGCVVTTSWVGVAFPHERIPKIFVTRVLGEGGKGARVRREPVWTATREGAELAHQAEVLAVKETVL